MKKKSVFSIVFSLLMLGVIIWGLWFIYPFSKFGAILLYDHFITHENAKSDVKEYVEKTYGKNVAIKEFSFEGEARSDTLVASLYEKENNTNSTLYYDLNNDEVLFDEIQLEQEGFNHISPELSVLDDGEKAQKEHLVKAIKQQEKILAIYEKEMKKAEVTNESKLQVLETHMEKQYENLGNMYNALDSLSMEVKK